MAPNGRWDWLGLPEAQLETAALLSLSAREGLVLARACRDRGVTPRQLGLVGITLRGRLLGPRDVCRKITIARLQVRRAEKARLCAVCGRPIAPWQRSDSRYCPTVCRQRGYLARRRERQRPTEVRP